MTKQITYVLAGHARSGTSTLVDRLINTGIAGAPREYIPKERDLGPNRREIIAETLKSKTFSQEGSKYPVLGVKVLTNDLFKAGNTLDMDVHELLMQRAAIVYMRRRDVAKQAVSLHFARSTMLWHSNSSKLKGIPDDDSNIQYNYELILSYINFYYSSHFDWLDYFEDNGLSTLDLVYEDWISDPDKTVSEILKYIGQDSKPQALSKVVRQRQVSSNKDQFIERFLEDFKKDTGDDFYSSQYIF